MNILKIVSQLPYGTKLYSPLFGYVKLNYVYNDSVLYSIQVECKTITEDNAFSIRSFTKEGKYFDLPNTECMLFPSKKLRDWKEFAKLIKANKRMKL